MVSICKGYVTRDWAFVWPQALSVFLLYHERVE